MHAWRRIDFWDGLLLCAGMAPVAAAAWVFPTFAADMQLVIRTGLEIGLMALTVRRLLSPSLLAREDTAMPVAASPRSALGLIALAFGIFICFIGLIAFIIIIAAMTGHVIGPAYLAVPFAITAIGVAALSLSRRLRRS